MRKSLCVAVCAVVLTCSGLAQASVVSAAPTTRSDVTATWGPQTPKQASDTAADRLKTRVAFDARTGRADASAKDASKEEESSSVLLLIAGVLIMAVIIRRRSGHFD